MKNVFKLSPALISLGIRVRPDLAAILILAGCIGSEVAQASTFNKTSGTQSWNTNANWDTAFPNAAGAIAVFNSPTTASLTVATGVPITVGSISLTNNSTFVTTISGNLILDNGASEASITAGGTSVTTNVATISAAVTLNSNLRFTVNTLGTTAATATMTGTVTGSGDFIKDGIGRFSFSSVAKAYTGATIINQGRLRYTASGQSTGTSAITVNSGGSLYLDQNSGSFSFGGGAALISLNGSGDSDTAASLFSAGSGTTTLANSVAITTDSAVSAGTGTFQMNGNLSGTGVLTKIGTGVLSLLGTDNSAFSGRLVVSGGTVSPSVANALGSTSGITLNTSGTLLLGGTTNDRISNTADVTFAGGTFNTAGLSEGSAGVNGVGALTLSSTSTLNFGTTGDALTSIIQFSSVGTHTAGTLQITGYNSDHLFFSGLETEFSSKFAPGEVSFNGTSGYSTTQFTGYYEVIAAVPEPTTIIGGLGLLAFIGMRERRRFSGLEAFRPFAA